MKYLFCVFLMAFNLMSSDVCQENQISWHVTMRFSVHEDEDEFKWLKGKVIIMEAYINDTVDVIMDKISESILNHESNPRKGLSTISIDKVSFLLRGRSVEKDDKEFTSKFFGCNMVFIKIGPK